MPNTIMPRQAGIQCVASASSAMPQHDSRLAPSTVVPRVTRPRKFGSSIPAVTPPRPIIPSTRPYMPAPRPSWLCTTSGSIAQGAAAGTE